MKKALSLIILLATIGLFSTSCTRRRSFPDALKAYYPYQQNQTIYFHNEDNETLKMNIIGVEFSSCGVTLGVSKCPDLSEMRFKASAKYIELGQEKTYGVEGLIIADYSVYMDYRVPNVPMNDWSISSVNPYSPDIATIIGDTITMSGAIIVRNEGVIQFRDENTTWYLTK